MAGGDRAKYRYEKKEKYNKQDIRVFWQVLIPLIELSSHHNNEKADECGIIVLFTHYYKEEFLSLGGGLGLSGG